MGRKELRLSPAALLVALSALIAGTLLVLDASARQADRRPPTSAAAPAETDARQPDRAAIQP